MVHTKKIHDLLASLNFYIFFLPEKIFSEVAEQIEAKIYTYDRLSMRNKSVTHLMSLVTWFGGHIEFTRKPIKKIFFSRTAGQIEGKLHINVPQGSMYKVVRE